MRVVASGGRRRPPVAPARPRYELRKFRSGGRERWANYVVMDHRLGVVVGYFRYVKAARAEVDRRNAEAAAGLRRRAA